MAGGGSPGAVGVTDDGLVLATRHCIRCSYNLQGLPAAGVCPECGTEVALSLRDNLLRYSDPGYVSSLLGGVQMVQASVILMCLGWFGCCCGPSANAGVLAVLLISYTVLLETLGLVGWWKFSAQDPRAVGDDRGERPRRWVRGAVFVAAVCTVGTTALNILAGGAAVTPLGAVRGWFSGAGLPLAASTPVGLASIAVGSVFLVAVGVRFFASIRYIRWLAPRMPAEEIAERARTLRLLVTVGLGVPTLLLLAVVGMKAAGAGNAGTASMVMNGLIAVALLGFVGVGIAAFFVYLSLLGSLRVRLVWTVKVIERSRERDRLTALAAAELEAEGAGRGVTPEGLGASNDGAGTKP